MIIRDINLAPEGKRRIDWVDDNMPLLRALEKEFIQSKPLKGFKVAVSVHLEAKTARLCRALKEAGAQLAITGSNPLSTRDDIAAALVSEGMEVFAWYDATAEEYEGHLKATLAFGPDIIIDDGGDFVELLHTDLKDLAPNVRGGAEETTTGVMRMRARAKDGTLAFPMIALNDSPCKHLFDNRFGTGQSTWDGFMRATNLLVCGKKVVVAGFGLCGRGVAERARGLGANVIVCEIDPVKALQAHMEGYSVMSMDEAAREGDIFMTLTGCRDIIVKRHFDVMKDGAILANAGHFDVEINIIDLAKDAKEVTDRLKDVKSYVQRDGRAIHLLSDGRLLNLAAGSGHPAEIMDMSFALQALSAVHLAKSQRLAPGVYNVPAELDERVARLKLSTLGVSIDSPTREQLSYVNSYTL